MAVSRKSPGRTSTVKRYLALLSGLSRYDLVLALVPLGFAIALLVHVVGGISLVTAVAGGAIFGLVAMLDALFVNPPSGDPPESSP